jgi:hypothetical protein
MVDLAPREKNFNAGARRKRDAFSVYFMGKGAVEWQLRMVNFQSTSAVSDFHEDVEEDME